MIPRAFTSDKLVGSLQTAALIGAALAFSASGCATNVNDLLADLEYGDPPAVRNAVIELSQHLSAKEDRREAFDAADREAIAYLKDLASRSPEPTVRACAIAALSRLRSEDFTDVYVQAAGDRSAPWVVRLEAARAVSLRPSAAAAEPFAKYMNSEPQLEVRLALISALRTVGGETALRALLDAFLEPGLRFESAKLALYDAVRELSGKDFSFWELRAWTRYRDERFSPKMEGPAGSAAPGGGATPNT